MDMHLKGPKPAVFLDRDGVLTKEKSYVCTMEELEIFPYAKECVDKIKEQGYYAIVVTNQSGVARGLFSEETLRKMNARLEMKTGVDAVYYCPHYPTGKIQKYSYVCACRKPEIGMITQACKEFTIDLQKSYMVGDRTSDILLGKKAGMKTILAESGYGTAHLDPDVLPDYVVNDLRDIMEILSKGGKNI